MATLPSKKFILVLLMALLSGGSIYLFFNYKIVDDNQISFQEKEEKKSFNLLEKISDSDNDGLKDWEEALWKTDPNNPDTDGDKTNDGQEVVQGRNPLRAGPDDEIKKEDIEPLNEKLDASGQELTLTDIASRQFFANFLVLQQSGNLNEETKGKLVELFLANMANEKVVDKYSYSDLNVANDASEIFLKNYGNELAGIIKKYSDLSGQKELMIINRALKNNSEAELGGLDAVIKSYQNGINDLLLIKTPEGMAQNHLMFINSVFNIVQAFEFTKKIFKDPLLGTVGISQYNQEYARATQILQDISDYFFAKKIFFNSADDGYDIFLNNRE